MCTHESVSWLDSVGMYVVHEPLHRSCIRSNSGPPAKQHPPRAMMRAFALGSKTCASNRSVSRSVRLLPAAPSCLGASWKSPRRRAAQSTIFKAAAASTPGEPPIEPSQQQHQKQRLLTQLLPPPEAKDLLISTWSMLRSCFWPVILIYAAKDVAAFILHRIGHRLTNLVAESVLGAPISAVANPWWLHLESSFLEGNMGYQAIIGVFFLLCLPLNIFLNTYATSATMGVLLRRPKEPEPVPELSTVDPAAVTASGAMPWAAAAAEGMELAKAAAVAEAQARKSDPGSASSSGSGSSSWSGSGRSGGTAFKASSAAGPSSSGAADAPSSSPGSWGERVAALLGFGPSSSSAVAVPEPPPAGPVAPPLPPPPSAWQQLRAATSEVLAVTPSIHGMLKRVWWVDMIFNVKALPLQALSLLVLPMPFTLPLLLAIQLAVPCAIAEGHSGKAAMERSYELMKGFGRAYAWPFVSIIVGIRVVDVARNLILAALPPRYWQDVVEIPFALIAVFGFAKIVFIRLQDLMPVAAFYLASASAAAAAASASAGPAQPGDDLPGQGAMIIPSQIPSL